jgi:hypothetical protein
LTILTKSAPLVRYRFSVRVYIIAIILAILVPTLISVGFLAMNSARSERAQLEQSAKDEAREATAAIERDLIGIENVLMTLAGSPSLRSGDIEAFYGQAADVSRNLGLLVTLWDVHLDAQVMNTVFPWETPLTGAALPPLSEVSKELLRSGTPVVSGVFFGALVKQYVVAVMVPVFRGKELMFFLSAGAPLGRFAEILESLNVGSGQIIGVADHNGSFVARSDKNNEFVGTRALNPAPPSFIADPLCSIGLLPWLSRTASWMRHSTARSRAWRRPAAYCWPPRSLWLTTGQDGSHDPSGRLGSIASLHARNSRFFLIQRRMA